MAQGFSPMPNDFFTLNSKPYPYNCIEEYNKYSSLILGKFLSYFV